MSVEAAILDECNRCRAETLELRRIRVTPHAIQGSPAALPFWPSCAALGEQPAWATHRWREILVHPEDWAELRQQHGLDGWAEPDGEIIFGIEVVR